MDENLFFVWSLDTIDSSSFEETENPRPLYVCLLCADTEQVGCSWPDADIVRGYDPRDGMFERGGRILMVVGGIDLSDDRRERRDYRRTVQNEMLAELEAEREAVLVRGEN